MVNYILQCPAEIRVSLGLNQTQTKGRIPSEEEKGGMGEDPAVMRETHHCWRQ